MTKSQPIDTKDTTPTRQAFLFDLDGTLIDSVYQHVLAWREALEAGGIHLAVWRIHRQIGMSGGLFVNALARETGRSLSAEEAERIHQVHAKRSNVMHRKLDHCRVRRSCCRISPRKKCPGPSRRVDDSKARVSHFVCWELILTFRSSLATWSNTRSPIRTSSSRRLQSSALILVIRL